MALKTILDFFQTFQPGNHTVDGQDCFTLARMLVGAVSGIVALAGGGANGTSVSYGMTSVDTVANAGDSIQLAPALPGGWCVVYNNGMNSMQVFGQQANQDGSVAGDQLVPNNSLTPAAIGTGIAQASGVVAIYICFTAGVWKQMLSA